jgi:endopeptidase Clp ATP-binding regulatory subunit ClpX
MHDKKLSLPSQKDLEKEIGEYLSEKYGERVKIISTGFFPNPEKLKSDAGKKYSNSEERFDFSVTPEELITYLDDYVIQQDDAKAVLATKICTHFNRIRYTLDNPQRVGKNIGQVKSNVLLIGPTGVGKTFLIKLIAQRLGVPFVKGDATKFSETGYVGGDVEDLIRDLVSQADGDIERAQYGIVYVDEIDKIASSSNRLGADVSRTGVQRALLKPMEETEVDLKVPHDPISQIEAVEHFRATGKREKRVVNTKNILFVMSGAFAGLEEIIKKRVQQQSMGFEGTVTSKKDSGLFLKQVKAEDLVQYGFESEFVGRVPVVTVLDELTEDDFYQILLNPNSAVVVGKKHDFMAYGIRILFEKKALKEIARRATGERTGARGLVSIMEKKLLPFEKKLPSTNIKHLVVTANAVKRPEKELQALLATKTNSSKYEELFDSCLQKEQKRTADFIVSTLFEYLADRDVVLTPDRIELMAKQCLKYSMQTHDVAEKFIEFIGEIRKCEMEISEKCELSVIFSEEAIDRILARKTQNFHTVTEICKELFNEFEYGLRLLSQKGDKVNVLIPAEGVDSPGKFINTLVEKSFGL